MPGDSDESNATHTLSFLRRRGLWIVLCVVVAVAAAVGYSKLQVKKYTATASLVFSSNPLNQEIAGFPTSVANAVKQQASNLELLSLGDMAARAATAVGHGLTTGQVSGDVTVHGQPESSIAGVSATSTSPAISAAIANAYAHEFVKEQQRENQRYFRSALALVHKQLAALPPRQRTTTNGLALQTRAQSLQLLAGLQANTVQIAQEARVPTAPSSPRTKRSALIGGLLGLFLGLGLALFLERMDPRIRDPKELEAIYGAPLLGIVPRSAALAQVSADPPPLPLVDAEIFHMIRARLRSFNAHREIRTVLVVSATSGEGKTTVARHIAAAAARMGSRVILLEADLRHPTLAGQLGLRVHAGLAQILRGTATVDEATFSIGSQAPISAGQGSRSFTMLPSGPSIPANPIELIESHAMGALLAQVSATYDLVVLDTPDLAAVSDALLLLSKVDGVVVVGRSGYSRRDSAKRAKQMLDASGAPLVGVVANSGKPSGDTFDMPPATPDGRTADEGLADPIVSNSSVGVREGFVSSTETSS